ncbi:alpha/beta hydrolase [Aliishimia ponticola]|uniref:Alpha/beta hydrolase n=1 Tax=Aliishimia ponticola TaxID=2499833 RepID=A0A4S4N9N8_9RHOB|nr:alpha/beta hydrolase [Aliishimia ponticola]THH35972.1 alpha/beta hydrolase [Aliishimia ponticola]
MTHTAAPLFTDINPGPEDGAAWWVNADDGVRLRVGVWGRKAQKGTVLLFPGRTEYVEKYAPAAGELAARGFATLAVDWRGQGLADRLADDPLLGHVVNFPDYQKDVGAVLRLAHALDLPKPWNLVAHSMGGCIGLRALIEGLPVNAAAFTGPMWGIRVSPPIIPVAWTLAHVMPMLGLGNQCPPGTNRKPYVATEPFADNTLTTDPEMFEMMRKQVTTHEALALGGPSYVWLREALTECARLAAMASPKLPCVTFLGDNERIVLTDRIHERMARWPGGRLEMVPGGEHEVMMETPQTRHNVFDDMATLFGG